MSDTPSKTPPEPIKVPTAKQLLLATTADQSLLMAKVDLLLGRMDALERLIKPTPLLNTVKPTISNTR